MLPVDLGREPSVSLICLVAPLRLIVSVITCLGEYWSTAMMNCSVEVIARPLTAVMRSPDFRPAAAAGAPGPTGVGS